MDKVMIFDDDGNMLESINGMCTKYGKRSIGDDEVRYRNDKTFGDGYSYKMGVIPFDGISMDIMKDGKVFAWKHMIVRFRLNPKTATDDDWAEIGDYICENRLREMGLI